VYVWQKIWNKIVLSGPQKERAPNSGTEHYGTKPALHLDIMYALRYSGKLQIRHEQLQF